MKLEIGQRVRVLIGKEKREGKIVRMAIVEAGGKDRIAIDTVLRLSGDVDVQFDNSEIYRLPLWRIEEIKNETP